MRTSGDKMQSVIQFDVILLLMLAVAELVEAVEDQRAAPS